MYTFIVENPKANIFAPFAGKIRVAIPPSALTVRKRKAVPRAIKTAEILFVMVSSQDACCCD
jgi:hypothetical protein